jgi:hypothetical protein
MSCNNRRNSRTSTPQFTGGTLPTNPCERLAYLRNQQLLLATGQSVTAIETPELGRVEFSAASPANLDMEIARAAAECAALTGTVSPGFGRRKPISIEAWP